MPGLDGATVLVTGGTGFLGSHLVRRLAESGAAVHVFARHTASFHRLAAVHHRISICSGDVAQARDVDACLATTRPSHVFHCAGLVEGRHWTGDWTLFDRSVAVNVSGTLNVLRAVAERAPAARVVRTGGLSEYGPGEGHRETSRERPITAYACGQTAATHVAEAIARMAGLALVTLRPALIYGPSQADTFFIPSLIATCLEGRPFDMTAGDRRRDLVFVDDVVDACLKAAQAPAAVGRIINITSGQGHRMRDIADRVLQLTGQPASLVRNAHPGQVAAKADCLVGDPALAWELLSWRAATELQDGLARTVAWFRSRLAAKS